MNLLTRLFALHFDRSFSGKGWRQLAWLFGVIVTVFLLIYLINLKLTRVLHIQFIYNQYSNIFNTLIKKQHRNKTIN